MDPWARQEGETSKAYAAFCVYRDQGEGRTTRSTAEALTKSETLIKTWSSKHGWVARAAAWDSMPSNAVAEAYADMAARIAAQHERVASKLLDRLEKGMDALPEGASPSQTWTLAHGAARQGHNYATDLSKPETSAKEEMTKAIEALVNRLAGE